MELHLILTDCKVRNFVVLIILVNFACIKSQIL